MIHILEPKLDASLKPFETRQHDQNKTILASLELATEVECDGSYTPGFVEIGVFEGRTSQVIMLTLNELNYKSNFYAVDLNQPYYRTLNKQQFEWTPQLKFHETCKDLLDSSNSCVGQFVAKASQEAAKDFEDETLHWCFIDACHCFECCHGDIEAYAPKMAKGGYLLVHDTTESTGRGQADQWYHDKENPRKFGVKRALEESQSLKNDFELFCDVNHGYGLQVWRKK